MKLLEILKEIKVLSKNIISIDDLQYNPKIDSEYPSPHDNNSITNVRNKKDFDIWKYMSKQNGFYFYKLIPNPNKKFWYQGDLKLIHFSD